MGTRCGGRKTIAAASRSYNNGRVCLALRQFRSPRRRVVGAGRRSLENLVKLCPAAVASQPIRRSNNPDSYGFSARFAWVNERFGVSWQLNL